MLEKLKKSLFDILIFFKIVDAHDNQLSITNIALIILLYKLITAPVTSMMDLGALMVGMLNYGYKKFLNQEVTNKLIEKAKDVAT